MGDTAEQHEKQPEHHLKPYQFKKGVSGNPSGRKKGSKSLKTYAREYLESLPDEEKEEYMHGMDKKTVWEMAEGKPKQDTDITSGGKELQPLLVKIIGEDETTTKEK